MSRAVRPPLTTEADILRLRQANATLMGRRPVPEVRRLPSGLIVVRGAPPIVDQLLRESR